MQQQPFRARPAQGGRDLGRAKARAQEREKRLVRERERSVCVQGEGVKEGGACG
jgi:hypothetical protein